MEVALGSKLHNNIQVVVVDKGVVVLYHVGVADTFENCYFLHGQLEAVALGLTVSYLHTVDCYFLDGAYMPIAFAGGPVASA